MIITHSNNSIYFNINKMDTYFEDIYDLTNFTPTCDVMCITVYYKGLIPDYFIFEDKKYKSTPSYDHYFELYAEAEHHKIKKILDLEQTNFNIYIKTNISNKYVIYTNSLQVKTNDFLSSIELGDASFVLRQSDYAENIEKEYIDTYLKLSIYPDSKKTIFANQLALRSDYEEISKSNVNKFHIDLLNLISCVPTVYIDLLFTGVEFQTKRKKIQIPVKYKYFTSCDFGEVVCDVFIERDIITFYLLELKLPDMSSVQYKNTCTQCTNTYPKHLKISDETKYKDICRHSLQTILDALNDTKYTRISIELMKILDVLNITDKRNNVVGNTIYYKRI